MLSKDLKRLVQNGETDRVEFKKKISQPHRILREIVAFANTGGGILLIGVDDDCKIVGVRDSIEEMETLNKSLHDLVRPKINFKIELVPITKKREVISYEIRESRNKPHFLNPSPTSKHGVVYYRYQDKSIKASKELIEVIRKRRKLKKGYFLHYGPAEEQIVKMVSANPNMTINQILGSTNLTKNNVSKALINLVLANVLDIEPRDGEDFYIYKETA